MNSSLLNELKSQYSRGGMTIRLIIINAIAFVTVSIITVIGRLIGLDFSSFLHTILALQTDTFQFLTHPWGIFTSIFTHFGLFHFIFNMLFLYFAGQLLENFLSHQRILSIYLIGGVLGGLFEVIAHTLFISFSDQNSMIVGASGSIMALFVACATYAPHQKVNLFGILPVKIGILALIYFLYDLLSLGLADGTAHFAHIGGAVAGYLAIKKDWFKKIIESVENWIHQINNQLFNKRNYGSNNHFKVKKGGRPLSDEEFNIQKKNNQDKIDAILDKISKSGYESLTKSEKEFLFNQSKNG